MGGRVGETGEREGLRGDIHRGSGEERGHGYTVEKEEWLRRSEKRNTMG